ncbi:MAG: WecB/TagA/CpsF family glycosyltransferase [Shimia sp.]|uniref:WecB/TagA/CpsF family glycosyltransferase n=1 Tax=Shimia sp. TaxID=1954381 RepID=UPI004059E83E
MHFKTITGPIAVNVKNRAELQREVSDRLRSGQGFALATINLDHLVELRRDAGFATAYQAQDFVVADGNPVVWLSRVAKQPVALMPGSELVVPLTHLAAQAGVSVAVVGSTQAALAAAARALEAQVPGIKIVCQIAPPMGFDTSDTGAAEVLAQVNASGAGLAFLALGAPKQEMLAARGRELAPSVGFVSVGAGLDFLAGTQHRAPKWVQAIAMEWLWRLISSPARLVGRYARCFAILPALMRDALALRK